MAAWAHLLRLPNILTAPGDPLAGFLLASLSVTDVPLWPMAPAAVASTCLYAAGLVQNDLAGQTRDRHDRPDRPLAAGVVSRAAAGVVMAVLAVLGLVAAGAARQPGTVIVALVLLGTITFYNLVASRTVVLRPIVMGLCRGLSVLLGATAATGGEALSSSAVLVGAITIAVYVGAVTILARRETERVQIGWGRWLPAALLVMGYAAVFIYQPWIGATWPEGLQLTSLFASLSLAVLAVIAAMWAVRHLVGPCGPEQITPAIGALVRAIIVVQAALAATGGPAGLLVAAALVLAWPIAGLLARWAPSS